MADAIGVLSKLGIVARTAWSDAYTAVTECIPFVSETLSANFERIQNSSLIGSAGRMPSLQGNQVLTGATNHHLCYEMCFEQVLAAAMGALSGGVVTVVEVPTAGKFFAMEVCERITPDNITHRFWPARPVKFTISGDKGGDVKLTVEWAAKNFALNTATAFPAINVAANTLVKFDQLVFRVADQADAIAAGDVMAIEHFELSFDRAMKLDDYATDATLPRQPLEPVEGGFRTVQLKVRAPRFNATTVAAWRDANTALQADLTFTGSGHAKAFALPELRIVEGGDSQVSGPGPLTVEVTLDAYRSSSGNPMYVGNELRETYS